MMVYPTIMTEDGRICLSVDPRSLVLRVDADAGVLAGAMGMDPSGERGRAIIRLSLAQVEELRDQLLHARDLLIARSPSPSVRPDSSPST